MAWTDGQRDIVDSRPVIGGGTSVNLGRIMAEVVIRVGEHEIVSVITRTLVPDRAAGFWSTNSTCRPPDSFPQYPDSVPVHGQDHLVAVLRVVRRPSHRTSRISRSA